MIDRAARRLVDPLLEPVVDLCLARRISANRITLIGFVIGLLAMLLIATNHNLLGLAAVLLNRVADGLDGAVARRTRPTDLGGYLDIVLDFLFYSGVIFAFAVGHPEQALSAAFLIFSFVATGTTFLAFAIFERRRNGPTPGGGKAFRYLSGLTEGTETIAFFVAILLFPGIFGWMAWLFGGLCWITAAGRLLDAVEELR